MQNGSNFLWGVATSAYQSEGGYNGPGQPSTNWALAEINKRVIPVGQAAAFWTQYECDFKLCRQIGLNAFRMSIEWSRVQPTMLPNSRSIPEFDNFAILQYAKILDRCLAKGLEPIVTLHHFVHPAWLGQDPWLSSETAPLFLAYVQHVVIKLNDYLIAHGRAPLRYFITINEPNMLVINTYLTSNFPSSVEGGINTALQALNNLISTHIRAYNLLHDIYLSNGWIKPLISINNYTSDIYWLDKMLLDLLHMREYHLSIGDHFDVLKEKSKAFQHHISSKCKYILRPYVQLLGNMHKCFANHLTNRYLTRQSFLQILDTLYHSTRESALDYIAIDYYDPFSAHILKIPDAIDLSQNCSNIKHFFENNFISKWWDWKVLPEGLTVFSEYYSQEYRTKGLLIAENGMAHRRHPNNHFHHRRDGMLRSNFLHLHIGEVLSLLNRGVPLIGYMHWSLFDNYEWGNYEARFGLYSVDYSKSAERCAYDPYGDCPSKTYAEIIRKYAKHT